MKKDNLPAEDDLRPEYNLENLRVIRIGIERTSFVGQTVRLEPDVAKVFPDADSVNEALRFLIRIAQKNQEFIPKTNSDIDK